MMSVSNLQATFNEAQREILQLFAGGLTESQLRELRRILLDFKFNRVTELADQFADDRGWTSKEIAEDAQNIERKSYKNAQR
jgi:hypothetical protein